MVSGRQLCFAVLVFVAIPVSADCLISVVTGNTKPDRSFVHCKSSIGAHYQSLTDEFGDMSYLFSEVQVGLVAASCAYFDKVGKEKTPANCANTAGLFSEKKFSSRGWSVFYRPFVSSAQAPQRMLDGDYDVSFGPECTIVNNYDEKTQFLSFNPRDLFSIDQCVFDMEEKRKTRLKEKFKG